VAEQGAGFSVANPPADFVSSIQATDLAFGPDSKIYISEWGEGWEGSGRGRIMALSHAAVRQAQSAQIAEVQKLLAAGFDSKADSELGALLSHPDQRIRLEAQWTLAARPGGTKTLATIARANASTLARIHALWGLGHAARLEVRQKNASPLPTLQTALDLIKDADPEVRAQAVRVLGDNRVAEAFAPLKAALDDPQPRVQFFAAQGLGRIGNPLASAPLVELLRKNADADPFLRMAASHALAVLKDSGALQSASTDSSPAVRLGALLAWRSLKDPRLASFLKDPQPLLVREAALAIHDESVDALPALAALDPSGDEQIALRILNVNYRLGSETHAAKLAALAANPAASEPLRIEALALLKEWKKPAARNRLTGNFQPLPARSADPAANALEARFSALLSDPSPALVSATVDALATLAVRKAEPEIQALALKSGAPGAVRARALEALATLKSPALKQAIKSCIADSDPALRVAAMGLLGQLDPDEAAEQLAAVFDKAAVAEKKTILASMGDLKTPKTAAHLARWVAQLAEGKIPAPAQLELVLAAEKQDSEIVRSALAAYKASLPASDPLAPFQILLEGGDRKAGEKLFKEHAVAACMRCHKVAGVGGEAGPELTGIGSQKDRRYLLESILFPNTQIAEGFKTVLLTLNNGEMVAGLLKKESPSELVIQAPVPGAPATPVRRADVKSIDNAPSGMPPNFADLLSTSELRDILEYLAGLREKK
ncbi:MAG: hypothetical protein RLZZ253_1796, partial [Verrucomicrobiota bacterium]